ncbi:MAG: hypothetical protein ACO1QB_13150 [Verrucomicrobiales bacterium]
MIKNASFIAIAIFWVWMNALLYHSEFGTGQELGSEIPVELVWEKILTAPDDSFMEINYAGTKIGYVRWRPNVGEETATGKVMIDEVEGMVRKKANYTVELESNFLSQEAGRRLRVDAFMTFSTNFTWQDFTLSFAARPVSVQIRGSAATNIMFLKLNDGAREIQTKFKPSDLQQLSPMLKDVDLPLISNFLPQTSANELGRRLDLGLSWKAYQDWVTIGGARVRTYRLTTSLLEKFEVVVLVSKVGEILKVKLPGDVGFTNEALLNL